MERLNTELDRETQRAARLSGADRVVVAVVEDCRMIAASQRNGIGRKSVPFAVPAITDLTIAGSLVIPFTIAAALEMKAVTDTQTFAVPDHDSFNEYGSMLILEDRAHPPERWTVRDIIEQRSRVGAVYATRTLSESDAHAWLAASGFATRIASQQTRWLHRRTIADEPARPTTLTGMSVAITVAGVATAYETLARNGFACPDSFDADSGQRRKVFSQRTVRAVTEPMAAWARSVGFDERIRLAWTTRTATVGTYGYVKDRYDLTAVAIVDTEAGPAVVAASLHNTRAADAITLIAPLLNATAIAVRRR